MTIIYRLQDHVISAIRAGEVITEISSIVKELMENSIDAQSTSIELHLWDSGHTKITITDDGIGMNKQDLENCFKPHTTSKCKDPKDLFKISSLGFRGEALNSIYNMSTMEIISTQNNVAYCINLPTKLEAEEIKKLKIGTTVTVKDIFHNIPVKRQFLSSKHETLKSITKYMTATAICYHHINIAFFNNDKCIFKVQSQSAEERINHFYHQPHIHFQGKSENVKINGFIFNPTENDFKIQKFLFVNRRIVYDKTIFNTIVNKVRVNTSSTKNIGFVIWMTINPLFLDVNTHPQKKEIMFANIDEICSLINTSISSRLFHFSNTNEHIFQSHNVEESISPINLQPSRIMTLIKPNYTSNVKQSTINLNKSEIQKKFGNVITEIQGYVIVSKVENGLYLIDKHAAHERITYEKIKSNTIAFQNINPITIKYSHSKDIKYISKYFSFSLQEDSIIIDKIPVYMTIDQVNSIFDQLSNTDNKFEAIFYEVYETSILNYACKNSIKRNDKNSLLELQGIVDELHLAPNNQYCNHGRKTYVFISNFDNMFGR